MVLAKLLVLAIPLHREVKLFVCLFVLPCHLKLIILTLLNVQHLVPLVSKFQLILSIRFCLSHIQLFAQSSCQVITSQRTCEVNRMGENRSFIFTLYVKTVQVYNFKLFCVVLHPSVKEFTKRFSNKSTVMLFYSSSSFS